MPSVATNLKINKRLLWYAGLCLLVAGCGQSSVPLAKVGGRVTFYGRPVAAEIVFQPETAEQQPAGRPSTATSGADGRYTLGFTADEPGAMIGPQRVTIKILPFGDRGEPESLQDATRPLKIARLQREVRRGTNEFDFAVTY